MRLRRCHGRQARSDPRPAPWDWSGARPSKATSPASRRQSGHSSDAENALGPSADSAVTAQRLLAALLIALVVSTQAHARIDGVTFPSPPVNGVKALETMHEREVIVVEALACRDEIRFFEALLGDGVRFGGWPTDQLFAKAAFVSDRSFSSGEGASNCRSFEVSRLEEWNGDLNQVFVGRTWWPPPTRSTGPTNGCSGQSCSKVFFRLTDTVSAFSLTPQCLIAQIGSVLRQPRLGQWEWDSKTNELKYKNPGTDGLPCISSFRRSTTKRASRADLGHERRGVYAHVVLSP